MDLTVFFTTQIKSLSSEYSIDIKNFPETDFGSLVRIEFVNLEKGGFVDLYDSGVLNAVVYDQIKDDTFDELLLDSNYEEKKQILEQVLQNLKSLRVKIVHSDITTLNVDIIVNAANTSLLGGSGVDGAIHRKGGVELQNDCQRLRNELGSGKVGGTYLSIGGKLPAKFVIHAIGPTWSKGKEQTAREILRQVYLNCLNLLVEKELTSIAFPNISTGRYGFPKDEAAEIAFSAVKDFMSSNSSLVTVIFACFDNENYEIYKKRYLSYADWQLGNNSNE